MLGLHLAQLPQFDRHPENFMGGQRLLTSADGHYYLRLTMDYLAGNYAPKDELRDSGRILPVPPLVLGTAWLHKATGLAIGQIAFFIPLALAVLLVPVLWQWTRLVMPGALLGPVIAGLAGAASFAWYRRIMLGRFDTDSLNLVLIWLLLLFTARYILPGDTRRRLSNLAGALLTIGAIAWWWPQGGLAFAGVAGLVYVASSGLPSPGWERRLKFILSTISILALVIVFTKLHLLLPDMLRHFSESLTSHLALVFKAQQTEFFNIGSTIDELTKPTLEQAAMSLSGSALVMCLSVAGLFLLGKEQRVQIILLGIPAVLFILLSLGGRRFLMFLSPIAAIGLGYLCHTAADWAKKRSAWVRAAVAMGACALIIPSVRHSMAYPLKPTFDAYSTAMAAVLNIKTAPDTVVWNWWGPGYLLQTEGKRRTIIDGGLQSPEQAYIAAVPLANDNVSLARNWIKFFSVHRNSLPFLTGLTGSQSRAVEFLTKAFRSPDRLDALAADYGLPERDWRAYFFPDAKVAVALFSDMLVRSSWLSIGKSTPGQSRRDVPIYVMPFSKCLFDLDHGQFEIDGKVMSYGAIYQITPRRLSNSPGIESETVALAVPDADKLFYMNIEDFDCLAFRLLFINPRSTPGFNPLAYNPFIGGVWTVE
ncbi:MAG: STT3 domain-containing protein [Pseudodesulfovibrio sp.]